MDVKDFRVGNIVYYDHPVVGIDSHCLLFEDLENIDNGDFSPIPLSVRWLKKIGIQQTNL